MESWLARSMEGAAVSAAAGALQPVLEKLAALLLGEDYKRFERTRGEIESLTHELNAIMAFLIERSKVEDPDGQDRLWMKDVRELSYDIEDSLDEFLLHAAAKSAEPDGFMAKVRSLVERTKSRHRIAREVEVLKKEAIEVAETNQSSYRAADHQPVVSATNASIDPRALAVFEDATKLAGVDGPNGELIRLLETGHGSVQQQTRVVSIVGPGGIGKTALAHQVYQERNGGFLHRAFLSVSRNPDIKGILRSILNQVVSPKDYEAVIKGDHVIRVAGEDQLITKIREYLTDKRYFIVLDDIWDVKTWNAIKDIFPMTSCGSKVITTTRINDVAQECCRSPTNGHIYNIRPLSMEHSTQLFYRRLFSPEEKCPSHLVEISSQILEKCAGLPLAIMAISGLLSSKEKTTEQWNQVKNSIGRRLERNSSVELMSEILLLSYFDLPLHLKICLLYLSIFPKDYTIGKEDLIRRWIAEGFIHERNGIAAYDSGERCFNDLINRSLIQPGGKDKFDEEYPV
ncbi:disease resistance protein RPP13-like isoform X2 [Panicum hallii]|uniref:disease resistance protein RPP13-like isoform X2 n=1 Tax=Panicum hallii TaxID=206008 RepID=UPI000DF4D9B9|nr:disease resistance protein RPP13-like isoform X2 [Panicum hallii]